MDWSASQYLKFEAERTRPSVDLLAAVPTAAPEAVIDIGCGPGNSTELLARRYPNAAISGLDSSPAMLAQARQRLPRATFRQADAATWVPDRRYGVIFANAVMQWIPQHSAVMLRLVGALARGGSLAVQMPDAAKTPNHRAMHEVAGPWAAKLEGADRALVPALGLAEYYKLLRPVCRRVDVWHTTYVHVLQGVDGIVEWHKSTGLRPFLAPLNESEQRDYLAAYRARLAELFEVLPDGTVLLPFPRVFIVASV